MQTIVRPLTEPFTKPMNGEIRGFGEVYEVVSIEHLRRKLLKKFRLTKNKDKLFLTLHPLNSSKPYKKEVDGIIFEVGFVDRPPWGSKPKEGGKPPSNVAMWFARKMFRFMLPFERFFKPHVVYGLIMTL